MNLNKFFKYSRLLGKNKLFCQGAGGNASVKAGGKLFIKASGFRLKELRPNHGFVICELQLIKNFLLAFPKFQQEQEHLFNELLKQSLADGSPENTPSIETGLHAALPSRYVFHTHNILANIFTCAADGRKFLKNFVADSWFLEYKNPGLELATELLDRCKKSKKIPALIFLKNHGVIVHHNQAQSAYLLHEQINNKILDWLKEKKAFLPFNISKKTANFKKHFFPDSVIYSSIRIDDLPEKNKPAYFEINSAINYITKMQKNLGLKGSFISAKDAKIVLNMEKEKIRINKIKHD